MEEKSIEQVKAESEQVQSFYNTVMKKMKEQVADLSHELAIQEAMNENKEAALRAKDANIQEMMKTIEELEQKIMNLKKGDSHDKD